MNYFIIFKDEIS